MLKRTCFIETVLLSTHNIMFWLRNKKNIVCYTLLTKGLNHTCIFTLHICMYEMHHKTIRRAHHIKLFYPKFSRQIDFNYTCIMSSTTDDMLGPKELLVASPIRDPGVMNLIMTLILEIDHEICSTVILLLPLIQEGLCVSYK